MEIEKLIKCSESKTLEFKRDLSSLSPIFKTLVSFANTSGGILIIGCSSYGEILQLLPSVIPKRTLRYDLAILREKKLLISRGKGRSVVWQLTPQ